MHLSDDKFALTPLCLGTMDCRSQIAAFFVTGEQFRGGEDAFCRHYELAALASQPLSRIRNSGLALEIILPRPLPHQLGTNCATDHISGFS